MSTSKTRSEGNKLFESSKHNQNNYSKSKKQNFDSKISEDEKIKPLETHDIDSYDETYLIRNWEEYSSKEFGNVSNPGTNVEKVSLIFGKPVKSEDITEHAFTYNSIPHKEFFWSQYISKFWLRNRQSLKSLTIGTFLLFISGIIAFGFIESAPYAPIMLCTSILITSIFTLVPLIPMSYGIFTRSVMVSATSQYGSATFFTFIAFIIIVFMMLPAFVTVQAADIHRIDDDIKTNETSHISIQYDFLSVVIGTIGSMSLIILPFIFIFQIMVWDLYTGVDMRRPINPDYYNIDDTTPWDEISAIMNNIVSKDKSKTSIRMTKLFRNKGAHYQVP